jgi:hypothetical protein
MKSLQRSFFNHARGLSLGLLLGMLAAPAAIAGTTKGRITTADNLVIPYVYESSGNSFAADPTALFQVKLLAMTYSAVPKEKCSILRDYLKESPGSLGDSSIARFIALSPLSLRIRIAKSYREPQLAALVQADLMRQGIQAETPTNATHLDRISNQLEFRWSERSLTVMGGRDLRTKAQATLLQNWIVTEDESGIQAATSDPWASATTLCDLQDGNLSLSVAYEYRDQFYYSERGNLRPGTIMAIWNRLSAKAKWIDEIASKSDALSARDARLIAAGSLLALEIRDTAQHSLLQPEAFSRTFLTLYNPATVEVSRFFNQTSAEDLADRLGKRSEVELGTIRGKVDL